MTGQLQSPRRVWPERLAFGLAISFAIIFLSRLASGNDHLAKIGQVLVFGGISLAFACALRALRLQRLSGALRMGTNLGVVIALAGAAVLAFDLARELLV